MVKRYRWTHLIVQWFKMFLWIQRWYSSVKVFREIDTNVMMSTWCQHQSSVPCVINKNTVTQDTCNALIWYERLFRVKCFLLFTRQKNWSAIHGRAIDNKTNHCNPVKDMIVMVWKLNRKINFSATPRNCFLRRKRQGLCKITAGFSTP